MKTFWVLECPLQGDTSKWTSLYYAGDLNTTATIEYAFKFGTKELAEAFLRQADKSDNPSFRIFLNYSPTEYAQVYMRVGTLAGVYPK